MELPKTAVTENTCIMDWRDKKNFRKQIFIQRLMHSKIYLELINTGILKNPAY